jgi:hypothetical protein
MMRAVRRSDRGVADSNADDAGDIETAVQRLARVA